MSKAHDKHHDCAALGYADASAELEAILRDIESGGIDLDELSSKVERAAALLTHCREKLAATATRVRTITADLTTSMEPNDASSEAEQ